MSLPWELIGKCNLYINQHLDALDITVTYYIAFYWFPVQIRAYFLNQ